MHSILILILEVLPQFYSWGNWGLEQLSQLPQVSQWVNAGVQTQVWGLIQSSWTTTTFKRAEKNIQIWVLRIRNIASC